MKQIEGALHAIHAENKINQADKSVETGLEHILYSTHTYFFKSKKKIIYIYIFIYPVSHFALL